MSKSDTRAFERRCEVAGTVIICLSILLFMALVTDTFRATGQTGRPIDGMTQVGNMLGPPGALIAGWLAILFGDASHVIYSLTFIWGLMLFSHRPVDRLLMRFLGMAALIAGIAGLLELHVGTGFSNSSAGGALGAFIMDRLFLGRFGNIGSNIIGITLVLAGILLATDFMLVHLLLGGRRVFQGVLRGNLLFYRGMRSRARSFREALAESVEEDEDEDEDEDEEEEEEEEEEQEVTPVPKAKVPKAAKKTPVPEDTPLEMPAPRIERKPPNIHLNYPPSKSAETKKEHRPAPEPLDLPFEAVPEITAHDFEDDPVTPAPVRAVTPPKPARPAAAPPPAPSRPAMPKIADIVPEDEDDFDDEEDLPPPPAIDAGPDLDVAGPAEEAMEDEDGGDIAEGIPAIEEVEAQPTAKRQMTIDAPAPPPRPKAPRPKRVTATFDELPPNYEYPKRYSLPSIDLFDLPEVKSRPNLDEKLRRTSAMLEEKLQTFGIEAHVTDITRGPTITRFELEPAAGVKVSRFLALADDIALALKAHRVRVEAPIPGKGRVGIEVPNQERDQVLLRELLESPKFHRGGDRLMLALGKDIAGDVQVADLTRMPHLLVAGATGAGKTVCVKALLASLLCQHTPDELHLILIDPKMVELSIFNDIPNLITPVVVDPKKAATALSWLINEMEERYRLFADLRVRNIEVYNKSVENGEIVLEGAEGAAEPTQTCNVVRKLPYIVCVVDELADLMMLARAEVEDAIARLAQLARAVGIHLIIATQRPSVDVLTGVIKANFPARISFQVSSRVDSRCILDEIGAERLIGMGDLLYLPAGQSKPTRIQGAFVSDEEMAALVSHLKMQAPPQYKDEIANYGSKKESLAEAIDEDDPLFDEAVQVVLETGQASISMVQRRLRVGYTRAARLIDMMELKGIVGPHEGSKAREILVDIPHRDDAA